MSRATISTPLTAVAAVVVDDTAYASYVTDTKNVGHCTRGYLILKYIETTSAALLTIKSQLSIDRASSWIDVFDGEGALEEIEIDVSGGSQNFAIPIDLEAFSFFRFLAKLDAGDGTIEASILVVTTDEGGVEQFNLDVNTGSTDDRLHIPQFPV